MCEFPAIEVGMEVNYMMFTMPIPKLDFSTNMNNGEYQMSLLDFVPGKAAKIMSKFGLEVGIEFKLDDDTGVAVVRADDDSHVYAFSIESLRPHMRAATEKLFP